MAQNYRQEPLLECDQIDTIHDAIKEHILDIGVATPKTLTGFTWRIDVRMRMDNYSKGLLRQSIKWYGRE